MTQTIAAPSDHENISVLHARLDAWGDPKSVMVEAVARSIHEATDPGAEWDDLLPSDQRQFIHAAQVAIRVTIAMTHHVVEVAHQTESANRVLSMGPQYAAGWNSAVTATLQQIDDLR